MRKRVIVAMLVSLLFSMPAYSSDVDEGNSYVSMVPPVIITDSEIDEMIEYETEGDPLEPFNRAIYEFNSTFDKYILKPVAGGYRAIVPEYGRERISNALNNISSPISFVNNVFQGDVDGAFTTFWRFVINSTIGIGGLNDVAIEFGLENSSKDFGQTLGVYGVDAGAYVVIPFLGPTTIRDGTGRIVDFLSSPISYADVGATTVYRVVDSINTRELLLDFTDDLEDNAFDPYASIKSAYLQNREKRIREAVEAKDTTD